MSTAAPIFIVGANRSGTTLLRLMLNAHSRLAVPEELRYFRSDYAGTSIDTWRSPNLSSAAYETIVRDFVTEATTLHPELNGPTLLDRILNGGAHDLRRPYQVVLDAWATLHGKVRWGEKTPGNLFYVDVLCEMFPNAYFLYVVRDPRAGVASMLKTDFFPNDVVFNAMSRRKHFEVGERLLREHVAPDHWMSIRYEDLTAAPEATLHRVCALIGEQYEPAMLRFHRTAEAYMTEKAATSFNASAKRPVTTAKINAWHGELSEQDAALIEAICAKEMGAYGYAPVAPKMSFGARLELLFKTAYWLLQSLRNRHIRDYTVKHAAFARLRSRLRQLFGGARPDREAPSASSGSTDASTESAARRANIC
jgi:hypothetical protein